MLSPSDESYCFLLFVFPVVCYYQLAGWTKCDIEQVPRPGSSKSDAKPGEYQNQLLTIFRNASPVGLILTCYLKSQVLLVFSGASWKAEWRPSWDLLKKLLFLDSIALSANVEALITDEDTCEELVETTGPGAQSLVNLLHAVCLQVICTSLFYWHELTITVAGLSNGFRTQAPTCALSLVCRKRLDSIQSPWLQTMSHPNMVDGQPVDLQMFTKEDASVKI